ncbi:MAG: phage holin family protein [Bacteroidales bacterium]|nr:phage holin family protein [Bacteroidales bacterium]
MKITIKNKSSLYAGKWGFLAQVIVMTLAAILADALLPAVSFDSVWSAVVTAVVIALLNNFIRPILIVVTLPFMVFTMGLFLFIVNACIILLAGALVPSFHVDTFGSALLFSILLTAFNYMLEIPNRMMRRPRYQQRNSATPTEAEEGYANYEDVTDTSDED